MKKITIYNANQYTKIAKLKKNAQHEMSLTIVDVEPTTRKSQDYNNQYIARTIKQRGYHSFRSPYIFTHIEALNEKNEPVRIFEHVIIGSDSREIITTPQRVYELLTNKS